MIPTLFQNDSKMIPEWFKKDPKSDYICFQNPSNMITKPDMENIICLLLFGAILAPKNRPTIAKHLSKSVQGAPKDSQGPQKGPPWDPQGSILDLWGIILGTSDLNLGEL